MESQESNKRYVLVTGNITCQFFQLTSSVWTYGVSCTSKQEFEKTNNIKLDEFIEGDVVLEAEAANTHYFCCGSITFPATPYYI